MSQEMSDVLGAWEIRDIPRGTMDWADRKALDIAANFIAIDGHENWGLPGFDWPSLCGMIAKALRAEREQA